MKLPTDIIPITTITAIVIFLCKEMLELTRKIRGEKRKKKAFRTLLAVEIEKNYWAIKSMTSTLNTISQYIEDFDEPVFLIYFPRNAGAYIRYKRFKEQVHAGGRPIPEVYRNRYNALLTDIAMADRKLFILCEEAYEQVANLEHIRESLIEYINNQENENEGLLEGFISYGLSKLEDIYVSLDVLYKECTGSVLKKHRLR